MIGALSLNHGYSLRSRSRDTGISHPWSVLTFYVAMSTMVWSTGAQTPRYEIRVIIVIIPVQNNKEVVILLDVDTGSGEYKTISA